TKLAKKNENISNTQKTTKNNREKMSRRLRKATILNLKRKSETEIDVILEEKLTDYKFSPSSFS
ncbi:6191_t:CDS:1, partial [Dentiscutata erythropus]